MHHFKFLQWLTQWYPCQGPICLLKFSVVVTRNTAQWQPHNNANILSANSAHK
jgi:hypothetical protein